MMVVLLPWVRAWPLSCPAFATSDNADPLDRSRRGSIYPDMAAPDHPPGQRAPAAPRKPLSPAAERALAEAAARRAAAERVEAERKAHRPGEIGGPAGPEPTRYGDWEKKGLASDF